MITIYVALSDYAFNAKKLYSVGWSFSLQRLRSTLKVEILKAPDVIIDLGLITFKCFLP